MTRSPRGAGAILTAGDAPALIPVNLGAAARATTFSSTGEVDGEAAGQE